MRRLLLASLLLLPLAGCTWPWQATPPIEEESQESSRPETKNVMYRGTLLPLGASIYMEGTHRLELEDGRFVLLESDNILLDDYATQDVEVFGSTRATVEAGGIIMRVENIAMINESSSSAPEETMSSSSMPAVSSAAPVAVSSAAVSRAPAPPPASSAAPVTPPPVVSSAPVAASSVASVDAKLAASTSAMAKANLATENWTLEYCSPAHLSFCFPVHKHWYFVSFGATSSSVWHVEVGATEIVALGDGPISIVLVPGAPDGSDGQVTVDGSTAVGLRAWTGSRHFEIRGPASLEQAIRYITQELKAAPVVAE